MTTFQKNIHYNLDFEMAVLGGCLTEKTAIGRIYGMIDPECFYSTGNKIIFETITAMYVSGIPIDCYTVYDQIFRVKNIPLLDGNNPAYYVPHLTTVVCSCAHLEYHSFVIKTMWMEREIIKLTTGGEKLEGDVRDQIYSLQKKLHEIQAKTAEHDWSDMTKLMVDLYQHQEEIKKSGGLGIACGFATIDKENGGFHPGQLVVIGARPSVGKSAIVGSMALHMAKQNKTVGIISLEMSNTEIAARLAALDTDTDFNVLYRGLYRDEKETHFIYNKIGNETSTLPIYVTDKTEVSVVEIKAKAQKLKSTFGLDCLIIDYLQLIDVPETYNRTRENEVAKMSRACKIMAKEMGIPVILLCQLNRESTKRKGTERYPQLSDLRESGAIEQDADVVIFLHRDWMAGYQTDENGNSTEKQADIVVRKWRNGKNNFIVPLDFDPPKMKFFERGSYGGYKPASIEVRSEDDNPF